MKFEGIMPALVTPLDKDERINVPVLHSLINYHIEKGADGDGAVTAQSGTAGQYGTFSINASGDYTYSLDNGSANVQALKAGQEVTESFTYTYKDADGDEATGTVSITITGTDDKPVVSVTKDTADVYEKHLSDGTAPDASALTVSGELEVGIVDPDGYGTPEISL